MNDEEALEYHERLGGKIEIKSKARITDSAELSLAYTPGVSAPCKAIASEPEAVGRYTARNNMVAIVTDGSAVLGLGNIGPRASLPVMEGKSVLFKEFADINGYPLALDTQNPERLVNTIKLLEPTFAGINLEDIGSPHCFEVEDKLERALNVPVFHDDQHGTAVAVLAGLLNALELIGKDLSRAKVVVNGAGAAGIAISKLLLETGARDVIACDKIGVLHPDEKGLNKPQTQLAESINREGIRGNLNQALSGADAFVGVSAAGALPPEYVENMADDPIIFALANPKPEISREKAFAAGGKIVATGRSDHGNQINNLLVFPGIFRGALDVKAKKINSEMKIAAARAISDLVAEEQLDEEYIVPDPFEPELVSKVAEAVSAAAVDSGVAEPELKRKREA